MKIRTGFISNSSSCSFCIFGWDLSYNEAYEMEKKLKIAGFDPIVSSSPWNNDVVGVGNRDDEFDHHMEDWQDYCADGPTAEEVNKLKIFAQENNLPKPEYFSATWFNG